MSFFSAIGNFFKKVFSKQVADDILTGIQKATPYVQLALPIVETIAQLAPNGTLAEAVKAYEHFGIVKVFDGVTDPNLALRDLAKTVVADKAKDPVAGYVLNLAIELAYSKLKAATTK